LFTATGEADRVALVSDSLRETDTPPVFLSSELSDDEESELEESELPEEEGGSGVFFASFRAFESAFFADSFSDSEDSESESDLESDESLESLESPELLELLELE